MTLVVASNKWSSWGGREKQNSLSNGMQQMLGAFLRCAGLRLCAAFDRRSLSGVQQLLHMPGDDMGERSACGML